MRIRIGNGTLFRIASLLAHYPEVEVTEEEIREAERGLSVCEACLVSVLSREMLFALEGEAPSRFFLFLRGCGHLSRLLPELDCLPDEAFLGMDAVMLGRGANPVLRFALLASFLGRERTLSICRRLRLPRRHLRAALLASRHGDLDFASVSRKRNGRKCLFWDPEERRTFPDRR